MMTHVVYSQQAGGALSSRADVEARGADPALAAKREKEGRLMRAVVYDRYGAPDVLRLAAVNEFAVGDHVFGSSGFRFGAHAEFICMRESARIAHKPTGMSFEEAAAVCDGGLNALWCLRLADLRTGQRILVYGASGAI